MTPMLLENVQEEGILEAARAFANFSRCPNLRQYLTSSRSDEIFVLLLEHENRDIVMSVCGVLMNLGSLATRKNADTGARDPRVEQTSRSGP